MGSPSRAWPRRRWQRRLRRRATTAEVLAVVGGRRRPADPGTPAPASLHAELRAAAHLEEPTDA